MKIITITGGKGGVGKSTIALNLAYMLSQEAKTVLVDLDVDNPYTLSLKEAKFKIVYEIKGFKPRFHVDKCAFCMKCTFSCPAHAIAIIPQRRKIVWLEQLCEGCGICFIVCPNKAITRDKKVFGYILKAELDGLRIVTGALKPPARKSIKVALETLNYAYNINDEVSFMVIDTPAGTSLIVKEAVKHATSLILVTEPTPLGLHDLKRIIDLVKLVKGETLLRRSLVVVNKADVKGGILDKIIEFLDNLRVSYVKLPYDEMIALDSTLGVISARKHEESKFIQILKDIVKVIVGGSYVL